MTRQKKQFLLMWIFLAFFLIAFFGIRYYTKRAAQKEQDLQKIEAVSLDVDAVDAFSYVREGTTYAFTLTDGVWTCDSDPGRRLDADKIAAMLGSVKQVAATEKIDEYESLVDFGLDEPQMTLFFTCGGEETTVEIGIRNEMLDGYYLRVDKKDPVYLVDSTVTSAFSKTLDDLTAEEENTETETEADTDTETES